MQQNPPSKLPKIYDNNERDIYYFSDDAEIPLTPPPSEPATASISTKKSSPPTQDDKAKKPRIDAHLSNLKMYNEKFEGCLPAIREIVKSEGATVARQLGEGGSGTAYSLCSTEEAAIEGNPCKFVVKFFTPGDDTIENETEILEELQDVPKMERNGESWQPYPTFYGSGECKQKRKYADGTVKYEDIGFVVLEALDPNPYSEDAMPIDKEQEWLDTVGYLAEQGFLQYDTHEGNLVYRDRKPVIIDWGLGEQWKKEGRDLIMPQHVSKENLPYSRYPRYDYSASEEPFDGPEVADSVKGSGVVDEMKLYRNHDDPKMLDKKSFKDQKFVFFMDKVDEDRYIYKHKATYVLKNPTLVVIDEDDDDAGIAGEFSRKESLDALRKLKSSNPKTQGVWLKFNDEVILWKFGNLKRVK